MADIVLSPSLARRLILHTQGLAGSWPARSGWEGVAQAITRLGHVQIDTIAVVERAHHHILWSRCADYAPASLHDLQARERRIFEYWWRGAACYLPIEDYRYSVPRMRAFAASDKISHWFRAEQKLLDEVLARIRAEGPLGSADFEALPGKKRAGWWDWKPAKHALELLFASGELMVSERRSFQRIYDLTERVLPPGIPSEPPATQEIARWAVRRMLASDVLLGARELGSGLVSPAETRTALRELLDAGEVVSVRVEGVAGEPRYALASALEVLSDPASLDGRLHILSPFDNAIWERRRTLDLFGFDFALECYLPAAKRRYGYFCLPILWGERFVGRLDPKADRKARTFIVRRMIYEEGLGESEDFAPLLEARLREYAVFNGCDEVVLQNTAQEV